MTRYQVILLFVGAMTGCFFTVMYIQHDKSKYAQNIVIAAHPEFDNVRPNSIATDQKVEAVTYNKTSSTTTTSTTQKPTTIEKFDKNVPLHVGKAISKLYREFKANGSIINDLITTPNAIIPNIYHYIRFNQPHMRFYEMLSIKSAIKVGHPEKVYIHTNKNPEGKFWDMIKNERSIQIVHREPPKSIFGKPFGWVQHGSDLARIQVLQEYGGIYLDNDCIVLNEFERLRKHHCVVSKSSNERHMGNMIMMATKDCVFMKMYEELYKLDYQRDRWYYNGGELPQYALIDQYPGLVYLADEGVQQGMMYWLWKLDKPVADFQKYWSIIHLFYGHKDYTYNDTTEYDENNIKTVHKSFARIARWLMYDHEDVM